jgi:hypothetical protein
LRTPQQSFSLSQLASLLDVSADIVVVLESRRLDHSTIPHALFMRLATVLQQPISAIYAYFNLTGRTFGPELSGPMEQSLSRVAERSMSYTEQPSEQSSDGEKPEDARLPGFRQIIDASPLLSSEQKVRWRTILTREGL